MLARRLSSLGSVVLFSFASFASLALTACTDASGDANGKATGAASGAPGGSAARFFLPTGEPDNTSAPTIEVDAKGGIHAVYPAYAGGGAYYAYCAADCAGSDAVKVVPFATDGTVHNAMIALDGSGTPHLLLSTMQHVYYATASGDASRAASWTSSIVVEHGGAREVTGEAFALDPQGHPRFLMHTTVAYLGIGQKAPETYWVACDGACNDASAWTASLVAKEMWQSSHLRFDAEGHAKVASVVRAEMSESSSGKDMGAYLECTGDCTKEDAWKGIAFGLAYSSTLEAVTMKPAIALALTKKGAPRVLFMKAESQTSSKKEVVYLECENDCAKDNWKGQILSDHEQLGAGLDLALDEQDHPRVAYTLSYNIGLLSCDSPTCVEPTSTWSGIKVEAGGDMPPDQIFLWDNCTVGAWFLHSPSLALTKDGRPRIGYQARDISGGFKNPDPTKPRCEAGTDMTWSRLAVLSSVK